MNILVTAILLSACTVSDAFQNSPEQRRSPQQNIRVSLRQPQPFSLLLSASDEGEDITSEFDVVSGDEAEDTVLKINFSYNAPSSDGDEGSIALAAVQKYTQSFPFAAVLPVQPLTYLPVNLPDGNPAVKVTFLRKKTAEKGSMDGGMLFSSCIVSEEDYDVDVTNENYKKNIHLTARRITKGQTVSKVFSEKQIIMAFVKGLSETRGKEVLMDGGNVEVDSVFHLWM